MSELNLVYKIEMVMTERSEKFGKTIPLRGRRFQGAPQFEHDFYIMVIDEFFCYVRRDEKGGHLCAYIALPSDRGFEKVPNAKLSRALNVHGGVTFFAADMNKMKTPYRVHSWIGFDGGRPGDLRPLTRDVKGTYRPINFMIQELHDTVEQLSLLKTILV